MATYNKLINDYMQVVDVNQSEITEVRLQCSIGKLACSPGVLFLNKVMTNTLICSVLNKQSREYSQPVALSWLC